MNHTLIFTFLLGGIMFSGVYYLSTILKNPALAAVLSLIPLSILCGYSLPNKKTFSIYIQNVLVVATRKDKAAVEAWKGVEVLKTKEEKINYQNQLKYQK